VTRKDATGWCITRALTMSTKRFGREKRLKGWSRAKKIALIELEKPWWEDFAEKWGAQMAFAGEATNGR
jgi:predicted GIY-YIG superfamily endonuclease